MLMAFICAVRALTISLAFRRDAAAKVSVAALAARSIMETLDLDAVDEHDVHERSHHGGGRGWIALDLT